MHFLNPTLCGLCSQEKWSTLKKKITATYSSHDQPVLSSKRKRGKWIKGSDEMRMDRKIPAKGCISTLVPSPYHLESRIKREYWLMKAWKDVDLPLWSLFFPFSAFTWLSSLLWEIPIYVSFLQLIIFLGPWGFLTQSQASRFVSKSFIYFTLIIYFVTDFITQMQCVKGENNPLYFIVGSSVLSFALDLSDILYMSLTVWSLCSIPENEPLTSGISDAKELEG